MVVTRTRCDPLGPAAHESNHLTLASIVSDDQDSDVEASPAMVLDKDAGIPGMSGGLILRKEKHKIVDKKSKKAEKMKIKF